MNCAPNHSSSDFGDWGEKGAATVPLEARHNAEREHFGPLGELRVRDHECLRASMTAMARTWPQPVAEDWHGIACCLARDAGCRLPDVDYQRQAAEPLLRAVRPYGPLAVVASDSLTKV